MAEQIKRPDRSDDAIVRAVEGKLAPRVKEWLQPDDTELAAIEADLVKAMRFATDGYEIARKLDGNYSPDAALVEILDDAACEKSNALEKACAEWVKASGIQEIPLESKVTWSRKRDAGVGIVVNNHADGRSTVCFPLLGHVRAGMGCQGYVVEWEQLKVEAAATPAIAEVQPA